MKNKDISKLRANQKITNIDHFPGIYQRIILETEAMGITSFRELKKQSGVSNFSISNAKKYDYDFPIKDLLILSEFFSKSTDWLLTGKDKENYTETEKELITAYRRLSGNEQEVILGLLKSRALNK